MGGTEQSRRDKRGSAPDGRQHGRSIEAHVHAVGSSGLRTISIRGFRLNSGEGGDVAGFDLGPGPGEHFLGALGASIAQAVSTVSCAHHLHVDRLDISVTSALAPDSSPGDLLRIDAHARLESNDEPGAFDGIESEILAASVVARAVSVPIALALSIAPIDPKRLAADDWQI